MIDKVVSLLIYPLGLSLLLGYIGLLLLALNRRRIAVGLLTLSIGWLTFWSLPPIADAVAHSLEGQSAHFHVEDLPESDVILVFGGVIRPSLPGQPYPDLRSSADRVWHAARLFHANKAHKVLLSGGRNHWQTDWSSQAEAMAVFLRDLGVPSDAILLEEQSRNTYENALYCAEMMQEAGMQSALLVTSALHMPRSDSVLRAAGVDAVPAATDFEVYVNPDRPFRWLPSAQDLQRSTAALHEWIGMAVYWFRGWMTVER